MESEGRTLARNLTSDLQESEAFSPSVFTSAPPLEVDVADLRPTAETKKSLWHFYNTVSALEFRDPSRVYKLLDTILTEGLDTYTAPPDTWHNTAMVAGRVRHRDAQLLVVEAGLREWPDNVDLLCDAMGYRQSTHYDPDKLKQIWETLSSMDRQKTAPYWRFWVHAATYHALELEDPGTAEEFLDEGLRSVRRDAVMDILRCYRRIYVDSIPLRSLTDEKEVAAAQEEALNKLESRLKLGITLGVENGYVLATELARLYQERAGRKQPADSDQPGRDREQEEQPADMKLAEGGQTAAGSDNFAGRDQDAYLKKALHYLDLAESLYTGNANHPVWEIYEMRIRVLMAQKRYGDALKFLNSLPASNLREDPSLSTMLAVAAAMTGEKLELSPEQVLKDIDIILEVLLARDGEILFQVANTSPSIQRGLFRVLYRLQQAAGDGHE